MTSEDGRRHGRGNAGRSSRFCRRHGSWAASWLDKRDDWAVWQRQGWTTASVLKWSAGAPETSTEAQIWVGRGEQAYISHPPANSSLALESSGAPHDVDRVPCNVEVQREPATCPESVLFIGGPGSGKTTLGQTLSHFGFLHISGGDVFRALNEHADFQPPTYPKVFAVMSHVVSKLQLPLVSFDGFLPKDFDDFEKHIGPIFLIVDLCCSDQTLLDRARSRQSRRNDVGKSAEQRVSRYLSIRQQARTQDVLASYHSLVVTVDVDTSLPEVEQRLLECVRAAIPSIGELKAGSPSSNSALVLDDDFWRREAVECFASSARVERTICERRRDPADGVVYTFREVLSHYLAQGYSEGEIRHYWKQCVRVPGQHAA